MKLLDSFVREGNVKATLDSLLGSNKYGSSLPGYIVNNAAQAFLTIMNMDLEEDSKLAVKALKTLEERDFKDTDLPMETDMWKPGRFEVRNIASGQKIGYFSDWRSSQCQHYEKQQWTFLAPKFNERNFSYVFHKDERPPFVYLPNPAPDGGHFGKVLKLGLHLDHLEFDEKRLPEFQLVRALIPLTVAKTDRCSQTPKRNADPVEVAVKFMTIDNNTTKSDVNKFYPREVETLKAMRELNDSHLIRAIAAYEKGNSRCFVFPWAEGGNLAKFWHDDQSGLDKHLVTWALDQMTGIAGGIMKLHERNIRHGDIKPLNILYFPDKNKTRRGILKVADVGLAKVHTEYTKYRVVTTVRMSSERYEPPEMPSYLSREAPLPRRYDSWSLGCVFLEFATWLIYGQKGLESFHRDLSMSDSDKFYERKGKQYPRNKVVNKLINKMIKAIPKSSALAQLVNLISKDLLVHLDKRIDTEALHKKLGDIRDGSSADSYRSGRLASLAASRPVPAAGSVSTTQPPDRVGSLIFI